MTSEPRMWVVRAGERGHLFENFRANKIVAIGWDKINDITSFGTYDKLNDFVKSQYGDKKVGAINIYAGQLWRFCKDFHINDYVITYNSEKRVYLLGKIMSDYTWDSKREGYKHVRTVDWKKEIGRDELSVQTKNTLGAIATIFEVKGEQKKEILGIRDNSKAQHIQLEEKIVEDETTLNANMENNARESIKDKLTRLDWEQMQELVAGILRAMGYKTLVSPKGADGGRDIVASPDGLGLEEPRIVVEVKHRQPQMGRSQIASFIGGLRKGHKGLYVSTGGFTKDAKAEADRSAEIPITLIDLERLTELVIENYDKFDAKAKDLLPMVKIYWPE